MKLSSLWDISFFRCPFFSIWFKAVAFFSFPNPSPPSPDMSGVWCLSGRITSTQDPLEFLQVKPWSHLVSPIISPHIRHLQCHAVFQSQFSSGLGQTNSDSRKMTKTWFINKNAWSTFFWPLFSTKFRSKYFIFSILIIKKQLEDILIT